MRVLPPLLHGLTPAVLRKRSVAPCALAVVLLVAEAAGCSRADLAKSTPGAESAAGAGGGGRSGGEMSPGSATPDPGLSVPPTPVPTSPCPTCQPGQACRDNACVDDCRPLDAVACEAPTTCDALSGRCVPPGASCVLTGKPVVCGDTEFPPHCGPGSRCENGQGCVAADGCARVVCDASGFCRGADCPQVGGGGVRQVTLAALPDVAAGTAGGIKAEATVLADGLCGLSATFELRKELELFVSAYNDKGIWRIPLGGTPAHYITETEPIGGITADRKGVLYYTLQNTNTIRRVAPPTGGAAAVAEAFAMAPPGSGQLARITFGPDGLLYGVAGQRVFRFNADGTVAQTWTITGSTFLTGLVFDKDGALLAGQHWPTIWRLGPAAMTFEAYVDGTPAVSPTAIGPWNEGLTLGPDGIIYVGVFPVGELDGVIYTIRMGRAERLLGLAEMNRDVPETLYAGVHGIAFGADGTLYFANQNTKGSTGEPLGQVLALRPSGKIELVAKGLNYDWPRGYDGDIVVSQETVTSTAAAVDMTGRAQSAFDAPTTPGVYGVRVLVTDPRTGAIAEARGTVTVR